ncbi:MAG: hypothetical protein QE269_04125 [Fimbriimonas sp.]|nr:hypothetical protein [Fimbriimonas sp.]
MKITSIIALLSAFSVVGAQQPSPKAPVAKLVPVHQPSAERGVMAIVLSDVGDISAQLNKDLQKLKATLKSGKSVAITSVGYSGSSSELIIYLCEAVSEIPTVKLGDNVLVEGAASDIDPVTIQSPKAFALLGFQPTAQLTDGSTAGVYQIGLNMPLSSSFKINGVLSSNMKDKQANIALDFFPAKNFKIQATSSQLGTSQMLTAGYELTSQSGPSYAFNYKGEVSPRFSSTTGLYFTRQLRVDSDVSGGADPGSGVYGMTNLVIPVAFDASGFIKSNFSLNLYYFPSSTADKFGVRQFEPAFDLGTFLPLQRPKQLKGGGWTDGMWLKLGLIQGVQPGNAFGKVSGFRFDIVKSF